MAHNVNTPEKADAGDSQFLSPPLPSPSGSMYTVSPFKRAINYNFWEDDDDEPSTSKFKLDDEDKENEGKIEFGSIEEKKYFGEVSFRITAVRTSVNDKFGETRKTIKFYGNDGTGEMAFTIFHPESTKYEDIIKVDKCLSVTGFTVSVENSKYPSHIPGGFEVKLSRFTRLAEATKDCPPITFNFKPISEILAGETNVFVDLLCVAARVWPMNEYKTSKSRNITLTDQSMGCIMMTLWNDEAEAFGEQAGIVLAIRRGFMERVNSGYLIKTKSCTLVQRNYGGPGSKDVLDWFNESLKEKQQRKLERKKKREANSDEKDSQLTSTQEDQDLQDWLKQNPNF